MKTGFRLLNVAAVGAMFTAPNPTFAQTWTQTSAPSTNWVSIASSADGTRFVAAGNSGLLYTSTNSGATWTPTSAPNTNWVCVASSADGTKLVAADYDGEIFASTDSGATWVPTSAPSEYWRSVASSADGNKLVAAGLYLIYTSTNAGATWTQTSAPGQSWSSVACSSDGMKLVAGANYGTIYTSSDAGATWLFHYATFDSPWVSAASSADGSRLVAASSPDYYGNPGLIYTSTNSGATWTQNGAPLQVWYSVASSADGTKLVAVAEQSSYVSPGPIYTSADSGASWTAAVVPSQPWRAVVSSADGATLAAVAGGGGGGIYTLRSPPAITRQPQNQTVPIGTSVSFSAGVFGAAPLSYQWLFNGANLLGATNVTLPLTNVAPAGAGWYALLVSNNLGSALSSNVFLAVLPSVVTSLPASGISATGAAVLNGSVTLGPDETLAWFEWGSDTNYGGIADITNLSGGAGNVALSAVLSGLIEGSVYHYRLVTWNNLGIVYGADESFMEGLIPTALTLSATGIATNNATLNASVYPGGPDTTAYFRWGTTTSYGHATPMADLGPGSLPVSYNSLISGLTPGTFYHCQVLASNIAGQSSGADVTFLTGPWSQTEAPSSQGWQAIASSADGTKLVAAGVLTDIYTSTNSGVTWASNNAPLSKWTSVASSADGVKLAAVVGGFQAYGLIYTSTNRGVAWTTNNAPNLNWRSVASSADGTRLAAVSGYEGRIYTSANAGATWISNAAPVQQWNSVASSADGTKLVAVAYAGHVGASTNAGASWTLTSAPSGYWWSVASSADGNKLVAAQGGYPYGGYAGPIYVSTNSGTTWTQTSAPLTPWFSVVSSADGTRLAAAVSGAYGSSGPIYTSTNSGTTWAASGAPYAGWTSIAASADGNKFAAACYAVNTGIYTLHSTPTPSLSLTPSEGNVLLSWTIPSLNFTLQQNSDPTTTNWTDMTTSPVLNLMNLQNQATVSPTNVSAFYRLKH